jgi:hypothetical protein
MGAQSRVVNVREFGGQVLVGAEQQDLAERHVAASRDRVLNAPVSNALLPGLAEAGRLLIVVRTLVVLHRPHRLARTLNCSPDMRDVGAYSAFTYWHHAHEGPTINSGALTPRYVIPSGMPSLLDPLPDETQQIVELVVQAYGQLGDWPIWQFVAQQALVKHGIDAAAAVRNQPHWPVRQWIGGYQAIRFMPGIAGNSSPDLPARTVVTVYGLFHRSKGADHPLARAVLKAIEAGAARQASVTLSPLQVKPVAIASSELVGFINHEQIPNVTASTLGLLLSGEPTTAGGGIQETDEWTWDLSRYSPLQPYVSTDVRSYLIKLDALIASETTHPYVAVPPETLPRALDHLNVVWKAITHQRLFYLRGVAGSASLVEPVNSGDQLTARLGALADIFDLFTRAADGRSPREGSLTVFRNLVVNRLTSEPAKDQARATVDQLIDINRIRNGRLHTDASNWAEALHRLEVPANEPPAEQWERIRSITVEAVYTIIELLQAVIE